MKNKYTKIIYPLICLLTAIIWGSGFPFQDMAGQVSPEPLDSFSFNGLRFLIAGIVLIPTFFAFERVKKEENTKPKMKKTLIFGVVAGAILAFSSVLQQLGIQYTGQSGKAGFITGFYLIIVPIATFKIFKQKPTIFVFVAIPISFLGLFFLSIYTRINVNPDADEALFEAAKLGNITPFWRAYFPTFQLAPLSLTTRLPPAFPFMNLLSVREASPSRIIVAPSARFNVIVLFFISS
jgi:hypothetical protein